MLKRLGSIIFLMLLLNRAESQLSIWRAILGDKQIIEFDISGKMMSYPRSFITPKTELKFKVYANGNAYMPWVRQLFTNLADGNEYIKKPEVETLYDCLFGDNASYKNFKSSAAAVLQPGDSCTLEGVKKAIPAEIKTDVVPIDLLLDNIEKQYSVKIYRNDICIQTIELKKDPGCVEGCNVFSADFKKIQDIDCKNCVASPSDQFRFELVHTNPLDETIRQWHKKIAPGIGTAQLKNVNAGFDDIDKLASGAPITAGIRTKIAPLLDWLAKWLWLTGGVVSADPFNIVTKEGRENIQKDILEAESNISFLQEKIAFLDSAKKELKKKHSRLEDLGDIQTDQKKLMTELETAKKQKIALQKKLVPGPLFVRLSSNAMVYQGRMELSKGGLSMTQRGIYPHKQFDAYRNFQPVKMNYFQRRKLKEIPENERMYLSVHNVPENIIVKYAEKRMDFDDQEEFTALLKTELSKIDFSSLGGSLIRNVEDFFGSLRDRKEQSDLLKGATIVNKDSKECADALKLFVKNFKEQAAKGMLTFPSDPKLFDNVGISAPHFRTYLAPVSDFEAPFRDSITIKAIYSKDSIVDASKTYVKVGKLRFFQLMAGVAIMKDPVAVTKIDTAGGNFRVSTSDNAAKAIFGFKIYPFKNYNRDHGLLPRYPLHRFSFSAGAELLHPLENFYLGGAYDVIPGLAFSIGTNINLQTTQQVQNGAIVNTSRRYQRSGTYYAVSVNPEIFVQFVKLFFK